MDQAATGRPTIVTFEGQHHGRFDTPLVSTAPPLDVAGTTAMPAPHFPSVGRSRAAATDLAILPWNDLDNLGRHLAAHAGEVAGLPMEPVPCDTGAIPPRPGYLEGARCATGTGACRSSREAPAGTLGLAPRRGGVATARERRAVPRRQCERVPLHRGEPASLLRALGVRDAFRGA